MDAVEIYHFLFETIPGIGVLIGACLVISIILSAIFELRIRKRYKFREIPSEEDLEAFEEETAAAEQTE